MLRAPMARSRVLLALALAAALASPAAARTAEDRPNQPARRCCSTSRPTRSTPGSTWPERGFDEAEGVAPERRRPGASTDASSCCRAGAPTWRSSTSTTSALAREKGRDLVGVMAIVQRPLAAVLAQPGIRRPRDLEGKRVGVTGLPSDDAVLRSIVRGDGGDPARCQGRRSASRRCKALLARPRRAAHRVLERRGRRAAGRAPGHARVPRRRLRRARPTPSSCCA